MSAWVLKESKHAKVTCRSVRDFPVGVEDICKLPSHRAQCLAAVLLICQSEDVTSYLTVGLRYLTNVSKCVLILISITSPEYHDVV